MSDDKPSVGSQFYMIVARGHVDEHILKCAAMMLNAAEKMARHLVSGTDEHYDMQQFQYGGDDAPVNRGEAERRAISFALMHGQLDMAWESFGFKKKAEGVVKKK